MRTLVVGIVIVFLLTTSTVYAQSIPRLYDHTESCNIVSLSYRCETNKPPVAENEIIVGINAFHFNRFSEAIQSEWRGSVMYGDGDTVSFSGIGLDYIVTECNPGQMYSVAFQLNHDNGGMKIGIFDSMEDKSLSIDHGETYAKYGIIKLVGPCP